MSKPLNKFLKLPFLNRKKHHIREENVFEEILDYKSASEK